MESVEINKFVVASHSPRMLSTLLIVLPVFALILAGWLVRKVEVMGPQSASELNRFVVYLALPALLFDITAHAKFAEIWQPGFIATFTLSCVILFGLTLALCWRRGRPLADAAIDALASSYANTGYMGFPPGPCRVWLVRHGTHLDRLPCDGVRPLCRGHRADRDQPAKRASAIAADPESGHITRTQPTTARPGSGSPVSPDEHADSRPLGQFFENAGPCRLSLCLGRLGTVLGRKARTSGITK